MEQCEQGRMKKYYGVNNYVRDWISTEAVLFCKVFTNPKTRKDANWVNDTILENITDPLSESHIIHLYFLNTQS